MHDELFSIKDKVVIITGGGGGQGSIISYEMAKRGALVYSLDLKFAESVPNTLKHNLFQIKCNITKPHQFADVCSKLFRKLKRIDVLINAAGVAHPTLTENNYPMENWKKTIDVNLTAAFSCSQIVVPHMMKNKTGSIINFTSINAEVCAGTGNPAYIASKGGLKMLGKAFAKDFGKYGIRVNNIGPGFVRTQMTAKSYADPQKRKARTDRTILGRWAEPYDMVGPCIFLASNASKYMTAQDIYVDGGWLANGLHEY